VRIQVLHALIEDGDEVDILRGLPEGSRLSPTLFGVCAAELIHELRTKFPELKFDDITSTDDFNWIGAFLYVDNMVFIALSTTQLQHMIDTYQEWSERIRMKINSDKTKIMVVYETPAQRASQHPSLFWLTPRFPLNNPSNPLPLDETKKFIYLGLKLDPQMTIQPATAHICHKINWAYQTVSTITHSLKHDTPASLRGTQTSALILYRIWQSCVLSHATQNLRYLLHPTQVQQVQSALISSIQRTLHCFTAAQITMLEMGIPPFLLRQVEQLISLHFRYTVTYTHLISSHLYTLRCQRKASNTHPQHSLENRIETAYYALYLIPWTAHHANVSCTC